MMADMFRNSCALLFAPIPAYLPALKKEILEEPVTCEGSQCSHCHTCILQDGLTGEKIHADCECDCDCEYDAYESDVDVDVDEELNDYIDYVLDQDYDW
jgi:hypothetical protein